MFPRVTNPSAAPPEGSARLACVRRAASVRSEPGSNSQVETHYCVSLTFEPLHILCFQLTWKRSGPTGWSDLLLFVTSVSSETESRQTVKLTIHHRGEPLGSWIYVQLFVHRMNQTAHISLQIPSMSKSADPGKNQNPETKSTGSTASLWRNPLPKPLFFLPSCAANRASRPFRPRHPASRRAPQRRR